MDTEFLPALLTIRSGKVAALRELLAEQPSLATQRSSCSHPTLLQALVLDGKDHPPEAQIDMARQLIELEAPLDEPLIAAASVDNLVLAELLLDEGASLVGRSELLDGWRPLEEALYWSSKNVRNLLVERGAVPHNLRTSAGLGDPEALRSLLDDGPEHWGIVNSPWGPPAQNEGDELRQPLLDNALVYAALENQHPACRLLLEAGARPDAPALGFDYRGTALHWAAIRGHRELCEVLLEHGADAGLRDLKIDKTAAEWAEHSGHHDLAQRLRDVEAEAT